MSAAKLALKLLEDGPRRRLWRFTTAAPFDEMATSRFLSGTGLREGDVVHFVCGPPECRLAGIGLVAAVRADGQVSLQVRSHLPLGEGKH